MEIPDQDMNRLQGTRLIRSLLEKDVTMACIPQNRHSTDHLAVKCRIEASEHLDLNNQRYWKVRDL